MACASEGETTMSTWRIAASAIAAGADMVAVISALFAAPDARAAARAFARLFDPR